MLLIFLGKKVSLTVLAFNLNLVRAEGLIQTGYVCGNHQQVRLIHFQPVTINCTENEFL